MIVQLYVWMVILSVISVVSVILPAVHLDHTAALTCSIISSYSSCASKGGLSCAFSHVYYTSVISNYQLVSNKHKSKRTVVIQHNHKEIQKIKTQDKSTNTKTTLVAPFANILESFDLPNSTHAKCLPCTLMEISIILHLNTSLYLKSLSLFFFLYETVSAR
jgi:hypothetical protein